MSTWITVVLTLVFKVWAVKKCHCWDWNPTSSVKAGLKVIVGLFSASVFFDEALWRSCFFTFVLSITAAKTGSCNCSHRAFKAKMTRFRLLLQCFIEFLWMQLRNLLKNRVSSCCLSWTWWWKIAWGCCFLCL